MVVTWFPRVLTLAIWALAAWSAAFWALRFAGTVPAVPVPAAVSNPVPTGEPVNVARVFGPAIDKPGEPASAAAVIDPRTRFALVGVVASRAANGVALLSVEGKPARPYRVGSTIDNGYTLKSVSVRSATLAALQTGATFTVDLSTSATGAATLGAPVSSGTPGRAAMVFPSPPTGAASVARPSS